MRRWAPSGEQGAPAPWAPSGGLPAIEPAPLLRPLALGVASAPIEQDVLSALLNLGCARPAAEAAVRKARVAGAPPPPSTEFEPLFRRALELEFGRAHV